jgi:hypothetical protein
MDTTPLSGWDNFYVIVGSAAGGLTGLTFVVIALVRDARRVNPLGLRAFVSPTMVHFGGVLALAAYMSMPHQHVATLSAGLLLGGLAGVAYGVRTAVLLQRSVAGGYVPVREDWVWNVVLPSLSYAGIAALGILIWHRTEQSLFAVAALALLLLFIGIRNAWDIAVWMTTQKGPESASAAPDLTGPPGAAQG